jgi:hypothetical protein
MLDRLIVLLGELLLLFGLFIIGLFIYTAFDVASTSKADQDKETLDRVIDSLQTEQLYESFGYKDTTNTEIGK